MLIFTIEIIPEFETRQRVYKLVRNGKCHIDEFWIEVKKDQHLVREGRVIWKILEDVANGERLPKTRYRKLKLRYNVYEVKSKELEDLFAAGEKYRTAFDSWGKKIGSKTGFEAIENDIG